MVVMDKLTKVSHFVTMNMTHTLANIVKIYMRKIVRLHGIPKAIVLDRDTKFTSKFWRGLFNGFGINMNLRKKYHLQSDG
jgi:hypothetical protein